MMMLEEVRAGLKGRNLAKMGRDINVTRSYLSALMNGVRVNPTWKMIGKVSDYLEENKIEAKD